MYRRSALDDLTDCFKGIKVIGDFPMHIITSKKGKFKMIDEVTGVYRKHNSGVSCNITKSWHNEFIYIYENLKDELDNKYNTVIYKMICQLNYQLCICYINEDDDKNSKIYLEKAKRIKNNEFINIKKLRFLEFALVFGTKPIKKALKFYKSIKKVFKK